MPHVALVEFGAGNLASVRRACERFGLTASIAASAEDVLAADGVILPGVGAFGSAMSALRRMDLVSALRDFIASDRPFLGICLGMQLLMDHSEEFGSHGGLGVIRGWVTSLRRPGGAVGADKVPHVGWNVIRAVDWRGAEAKDEVLKDGVLVGIPNGSFVYFTHSFRVRPVEAEVIRTVTPHGGDSFCSSLQWRNVFGTQFHPERSGPVGLRMYRNFAALVAEGVCRREESCEA